MSYDNSNSGVLFVNDRKETAKQPDFTGTIQITPDMAGRDVRIAGWKKTKGDKKFISLKVSDRQQSENPKPKDDLDW